MARLLVLVVWLCLGIGGSGLVRVQEAPWRIHTLFSVECQDNFDWQTVGLVHSFKKARQPGPITRLLSCTDEEKKHYRGMHLAPTLEVPSMTRHPRTGDMCRLIKRELMTIYYLIGIGCGLMVVWSYHRSGNDVKVDLVYGTDLATEKSKNRSSLHFSL
ncbi:peptidyl serine alpha-galactosyltransferase-like [Malania oleifera]|uniref:peptidyl serine alpha-galactosyltransferase-like n=1 Tax=Malania oleifera TaxID=397392 RepID=UPI0025AE09D4|nr:peptidyl serine alpha-galactosyltransferase-like [Malania oleifera]